ncbi:ATP-dependent DNA helicase [Trichonephila clavipes]|uniref:ATP-dependent DNA helicase n=1 Tax=Trichonephila clavipes TaxID=2585209 RepID=A0A8X6R4X7_TRICX|nr:ATP-dependent DNA helicase [Trichonephila clavipes]
MGRYISSNEAIWHILSFPIHERDPAVEHLAIHLENGQRVYFTEENVLQRAFEAPKTTLTEFLHCVKNLMFLANSRRHWCMVMFHVISHGTNPVKNGSHGNKEKPHPSITGIFKAKTLGRLYTVHPKQRECFYLRLLLVNVPGPTSFEFLRTVNGRVFNTYQDACRELQLLEDDNHWDLTLADAALTSTPNNIRQLFAIILTTCYPSQAQTLWEKYKNCMTEDILHRIRQTNQSQNIDYTPEMYNEALVLIEDLCVLISNLPLNHYGMPSPNRPATDLVNTDLQRENQYDHGSLATIIMNSEPLLTAEQKIIYDRIMLAVAAEQGGFFWMHPVEPNSGIAAVLRKSSIIIWDECTMAHKYSLEALNRTMQDLNSNNKLFGGAILLLSGDFRQTLPVIPRSTFADEINACLKQSFLWRSVETLRLTINMRVQLQNDPSAQIFSEQLLHIGNGKIELQLNTQCIKLPDNFCTVVQDKNELIQSIFPDIQNNYLNHEWLSQRAILAAKNVDVDEINFQIQQLLPGDLMSFKSIDTVVDENESVNFPIEFLNSLDIPECHHIIFD